MAPLAPVEMDLVAIVQTPANETVVLENQVRAVNRRGGVERPGAPLKTDRLVAGVGTGLATFLAPSRY